MFVLWSISPERYPKLGRILLLVIGFSVSVAAQSDLSSVHILPPTDANSPSSPRSAFRSDVDLVLVNVSVLDRHQRTVAGLASADFSLLEDKQPQSIKYFSSEDQPLSLAIVLDASASMAPRIEQARKAVLDLVRTSNPRDDISVVLVGDKPRIAFHFDDSIETLPTRLEIIQPEGRTALWDAMLLSLHELQSSHHRRRALVVISDGGDNHSAYTESELKSVLEEADVEVYAVGMFERFPRRNEERRGPRDLDELTTITGGRLLSVHDDDEMRRGVAEINTELRSQYVLGYSPSNRTRDGHWRKIKVALRHESDPGRLQLFFKRGYYAQAE